MDLEKSLRELREELDEINQAIIVLERIATNGRKPTGRPPAWLSEARSDAFRSKKRGVPDRGPTQP